MCNEQFNRIIIIKLLKKLDSKNTVAIISPHSLIAQSVERRTVNPQVPGSSPGRGARFENALSLLSAFSIMDMINLICLFTLQPLSA